MINQFDNAVITRKIIQTDKLIRILTDKLVSTLIKSSKVSGTANKKIYLSKSDSILRTIRSMNQKKRLLHALRGEMKNEDGHVQSIILVSKTIKTR